MATSHPNLPQLKIWFEGWLSETSQKSTSTVIAPLAGDGSTRTFYRAVTNETSYVLVSDPQWTLTQDYAPHQEFLQARGIPTPEFLSVDPVAGILLMEDLGDELLQTRIQNSSAVEKQDWLIKATKLLAKLHDLTFPVPPDIPAATRRFDEKKYTDELQFTETHLLKSLFGGTGFSASERHCMAAFCRRIASIEPLVFAHRDYHTRNILVHNEKLYLIDFQDARLGSPHYDVASLLFDPYVELTIEDRQSLLQTYQNSLGSSPLFQAIQWKKFEIQMQAVALQRVLKAAGSFAYFFTQNQKTTHLHYILPALRSAQLLSEACASGSDGVELGLDIAALVHAAENQPDIQMATSGNTKK